MQSDLVRQYKTARRAGVPLLAITTPDPASTIEALWHIKVTDEETAVLQWDIAAGLAVLPHEDSRQEAESVSTLVLKQLLDTKPQRATINLVLTLELLKHLPDSGVVFLINAHRQLHEPAVMQSVWNLRDHFKAAGQTLVILCPSVTLPAELSHDVLTIDDPLPQPAQLKTIVETQYANAKALSPELPELTEPDLDKAVDALRGLSSFSAEQATAMSLTSQGLDIRQLWSRKYGTIEQTPGLKIWRGPETFASVGGVEQVKRFISRVLNGRSRPRAIVFLDEVEKAMAGAQSSGGDSSGVSQSLHGTLLSFMQDTRTTGMLFVGPHGTSKSAIAKAAGNEGEIPTLLFDLSAIKNSLVGESERQLRQSLKIISTISDNAALFIGTCNNIQALSPELRRRFGLGTFFFPLPTRDERAAIWQIYLKKYGLTEEPGRLIEEDWTGAEIERCADLAWRFNTSLNEAAENIVPAAVSHRAHIETLYQEADGTFLSASHPGPFKKPEATKAPLKRETGARRVQVAEHRNETAAA